MSFLSTLGRMTLSTIFIQSGVNGLQNPGYVAQVVEANGLPEPQLLEQVHHTTNVAAGAMMALGVFPRLAAAALFANLVPTTILAHNPNEADDEGERMAQTVQAGKNISLLGGLLMVLGSGKDDTDLLAELQAELDELESPDA